MTGPRQYIMCSFLARADAQVSSQGFFRISCTSWLCPYINTAVQRKDRLCSRAFIGYRPLPHVVHCGISLCSGWEKYSDPFPLQKTSAGLFAPARIAPTPA